MECEIVTKIASLSGFYIIQIFRRRKEWIFGDLSVFEPIQFYYQQYKVYIYTYL